MRKDLHEANRLSWNQATRAHNSHKQDQAGFLRAGGSTLFPEEIELLGDIAGLDLAHLQCNSGQDSLSLAARGARVTGVDISDEAIAFAQGLSTGSGIPARFERADLYDWFDRAGLDGRRFDIVFFSYGALCWLSDIDAWARGVATILRPGGRLVGVDFHPFAMVFDEDGQPRYDYHRQAPLDWPDGVSDYVAAAGGALSPSGHQTGNAGYRNPHPAHEFCWGLGDIVTALIQAGLELRTLREYPYSNGCRLFADMREDAGRRMWPPDTLPSLPLMFGLVAGKPDTPA